MEDLQVAELTLREGIYNQTCFHAQQAAEKALKGFLAAARSSVPRTHSLTQILEFCVAVDATFPNLEKESRSLDRFYIPTRYPDALPGSLPDGSPEHADASEALLAARLIIERVNQVIRHA